MTEIDIVAKRINEKLNLNIFENTRRREYVDGRALFCYVLRNKYGFTLHHIAEVFNTKGKKFDHSSVVHNLKGFEQTRKYNPTVNSMVTDLLQQTDTRMYLRHLASEVASTKSDKKIAESNTFLEKILNG
tara:strand:- start:4530 stop:4919 length:390 start_codon:yes stop_codon:yes gene_type:complete